MSSAYALPQACPDCEGESAMTASKVLRQELPVTIWTDSESYDHNSMIEVSGQVANIASGYPVTITVVSPLNSVVTIAQLQVSSDGTFGTTLNTAGAMWKYDGTYTIKAQYGENKSDKVRVELAGGQAYKPTTPTTSVKCGANSVAVADGKCVNYTITGGMVTGAKVNTDDNSIIVRISAMNDGTITLSPSKEVLDGVFMVLVDDQEWDDVVIDGNKVTVSFLAGTEKIELIGTFVVPEFGTIAVMILAVAIISIIAVSAKSRLSIMPRY
ncbi:PEFG-CTERM sorting domain-containing protein [Nitrosopumilus sp. K4]|uniref:PEFG-CTERM sorting domain-containing protein n=1 Tax=Nitrosopumilus sp. K4 TaxID=2795383 RepID=UPI001BA67FB0|nr:PEFG-CTERM sorting domain-containing protein [Nitrosopumilus sp. K4]QUC65720.1 PEFG-CTERM sorting domain-containing protein [Nitrosopumilus sp. K4]